MYNCLKKLKSENQNQWVSENARRRELATCQNYYYYYYYFVCIVYYVTLMKDLARLA